MMKKFVFILIVVVGLTISPANDIGLSFSFSKFNGGSQPSNYVKIHTEMGDTEIFHGRAPKSMKNLIPVRLYRNPAGSDPGAYTFVKKLYNDDKICELLKLNGETKIKGSDLLLENSEFAPLTADERAVLNELFTVQGPLQGFLGRPGLIPIEFFNALILADRWMGAKVQQSFDLERSRQIMEDLKQRDPTNGAYSFFLAEILSRLGSDDETVLREYEESFTRPRFDTFVTTIARHMVERGLINVSYLMTAIGISASFPIPDYLHSNKLLRSFIEKGRDDFRKSSLDLASKFMAAGLKAKGQFEFTGGWSSIEYIIGYKLKKRVYEILYPEKKVLESDFHELWKVGMKESKLGKALDTVLEEADRKGKDFCNPQTYKDYFDIFYSEYSNFASQSSDNG